MDFLRQIVARVKRLQGSSVLPVLPPVQALVELAGLLAVIALADWALPGVDMTTLEPSPYWVPVLLLSLQYGTVAGLLAAAAASIAHVFAGFPEQSIGEDLFTYLLRIWALPMLWIGVALVLGQFRLRQIEVKQTLRRDLAQRTAEARSLAGYAHDLEARCQRLERHLSTGGGASPSAALDALLPLMRPPVDLEAALGQIAQGLFPGAALSVFSVTPAGCERVARSGWPEASSWLRDISASHPLYRALVSERRAVSVLTTGDELILSGQGLAACPIFSAESGRVIGIIKLDAADPALLRRTTPEHLAVIARLAAPALADLRVVVDNSVREARPEPLSPSWFKRPWRAPVAVDAAKSATDDVAVGDAAAGASSGRSSHPKRVR